MTAVRLPRLLGADLNENVTLRPVSLSVAEALNPLSTASMTMDGTDAVPLDAFVELHTMRGAAGVFRVVSVTRSGPNGTTVELEHGACTLGDAIIPGEGTLTGAPQNVLAQLLEQQTVKVGGVLPWMVGTVEATAEKPFDYDNSNLLVAITDFCESLGDYHAQFDQSSFPWKVHIRALPQSVSGESRITRNIRSVSVTVDTSERVDRIYCDVLPEGYIDGPNASGGKIRCKTLTAAEGTELASLRGYISRYLQDHKDPRVAVEIDADDLSERTGLAQDSFAVGQMHRLALPDYGVTVEARIIGVYTGDALEDPTNARISLANYIRDTEKNLVMLENAVNGGTSHNAAGGYYRGGTSGAGLTQENVLTMLKKSEMRITDTEAWSREAGIQIESNGVDIYAVKQSIVGILGSKEEVNAALKVTTDNGGMIAALVGRKNSVEEIRAGLEVLGTGGGLVTLKANQSQMDETIQRVSGAEIRLNGAEASIQLKASQSTVDALTGRVSNAEASIQVNAGNIELKVSKNGVISSINQTAEEIKIQASRVNLSGYVTASQLSAELAQFQGTLTESLVVRNLSAQNFTFDGYGIVRRSTNFMTGVSIGKRTVTVATPSGGSTEIEYISTISPLTATAQYLRYQ